MTLSFSFSPNGLISLLSRSLSKRVLARIENMSYVRRSSGGSQPACRVSAVLGHDTYVRGGTVQSLHIGEEAVQGWGGLGVTGQGD